MTTTPPALAARAIRASVSTAWTTPGAPWCDSVWTTGSAAGLASEGSAAVVPGPRRSRNGAPYIRSMTLRPSSPANASTRVTCSMPTRSTRRTNSDRLARSSNTANQTEMGGITPDPSRLIHATAASE